jgi:predicted N-formylglutamate amidohydrolase
LASSGSSGPLRAGRLAMLHRLLGSEEPSPVFEYGRNGRSAFVIAVDHAGRRIPRKLGSLGLPAGELERHIAWDIGALDVALRVASALDAPLVAQNYSRLVIDCNRDLRQPSSIPEVGESIEIPGNIGLDPQEVIARREEIFHPYHEHLRALLDERERAGRRSILVAQHSMTDVFKGVRRQMHAAVLYNRDRRFAGLVLEKLREESDFMIGDNEPYSGSDAVDYTIPFHAELRGIPYVELEIRQDLILNQEGQSAWARRIASALSKAEQAFLSVDPQTQP